MSNTTAQTIWQIQISGCITHCRGTRQAQVAGQQSISVQVVRGAAPRGATSTRVTRRHSAAVAHRPAVVVIRHRGITQIQIGCRLHCVDSTTSGSTIQKSVWRMVQQLLHGTAGHSRPAGAARGPGHNAVSQTIHQQQSGQIAARAQTEQSSQTSVTVQTIQLSRSVRAQLVAALSSTIGPVVSQTEQGIWQLQIGCLSYCIRTRQHQRAAQATTSIQVVPSAPHSHAAQPSRAVAAVSSAAQVIWQLQIGCLFWCYRATESQTAARSMQMVQMTVARSTRSLQTGSAVSSINSAEATSEGVSVATSRVIVAGTTRELGPPPAAHRAHSRSSLVRPAGAIRGVRSGAKLTHATAGAGRRSRLDPAPGISFLGRELGAATAGGSAAILVASIVLLLLAAALGVAAGARALHIRRVQDT